MSAELLNFNRGCSWRRYPGGERLIVHRWPASRMRAASSVSAELAANITRANPLLLRLTIGSRK